MWNIYNKKFFSPRLLEIIYNRCNNPNYIEISKKYFNTKYRGYYMKRYQWRTANNGFIYVDEMSKGHLVNTLNLLTGKRKTNPIPDNHFIFCEPGNLTRKDWINVFLDELKKYVK